MTMITIRLKGNMLIRLGYYLLIQTVWRMMLKLKMSMMICEEIKNFLTEDSKYQNRSVVDNNTDETSGAPVT